MARRGFFAAFALAGLLSACAGDEFVAASGSGGTAAGGGAGSGGGPAGGASSGGVAGTTGGAAGNGASGGAGGTSGGAGGTSGGAGGASGGAGGASGGAGGASGGTGGAPPAGCGNAHPNVALLYSTLDSNMAVVNPSVLKDGIGQQFAGSFVEGFCPPQGYRVNGPGQYLKFPALLNINLVTGTLDFFFKPEFHKNDGKAHRLVGVPGAMQLVKNAQSDLVFGMGATPLAQVDSVNLPFVQNQWVRITIVWKTGATDMVQIYFNGSGAPLETKATGPFAPPTLTTESLWVGAFASNDADHAAGVFDDLKIYDGTEPPL